MSYAVIQTGGKQYRVSEGDVLEIEKLELDPGAEVIFNEVLLAGAGEQVRLGSPFLAGVAVHAEVVDQTKADKVVAYKFKRRKGYHRTVGHRQKLTEIKITKIEG